MKEVNWIIVKSKGRGTDYGVGTFVNNLIHGFRSIHYINVFVLEIGSNDKTTQEFKVDYQDGVTYLRFSKAWHIMEKDTVKNQNKHAKNVIRIIKPFIPLNKKNVIHLNFIFQYFIGVEFKKQFDSTVVFTQHLFVGSQNSGENNFNIEQSIYQLAHHICTVTKHGKSHLVDKGVDEGKIEVVYNGLNPNLFEVKSNDKNILQKYGIKEGVDFVLYSGRLDTIKGLSYLATSFKVLLKKTPSLMLVFAGDGDYNSLISYCRSFSRNVCYLGFIPFEDLIILYKKAKVGVIPSLEEHCSYVALEMLHSGLPVVASKHGGLKEIFIHKKNALLVDMVSDNTNVYGIAPDVEQISEFLFQLLQDKQMSQMFSLNASKSANEKFTSLQMVKKYVNIAFNVK